jgi:short-subunit dehydrogenase
VTELERADLMINNAGLGLAGDFLSHDLAEELAGIQVNVQALVGLSHALGAKMGDLRGSKSVRSPLQRSAKI